MFETDEPIVIRVRHELGEPQSRLLNRLGASYVVDADAPVCVRFCGREECKVITDAVVVRGWCRMYGCGEEPAEGSEFCSGHQHAANEKSNGSAPLLAAEPGPVEPAPSPEGEERSQAGDGARYRPPVKWTRERVVAVIREVGAAVGHTPTTADMSRAGYASVTVNTTLRRLGLTWAELVREAGFEPRLRGSNRNDSGRDGADGKQQFRPDDSEREPQVKGSAERPASPHTGAAAGPASRSDVLLRPFALAARAFADAILEDAA